MRDSALKQSETHQGLDQLMQDTLRWISTSLYPKPTFPNQSLELQHVVKTHDGTVVPVIIPATQRLAIYPESVVKEVSHAAPGMVMRGVTLYSHGKVLLSRDLWCIETLLHEVLHSVSVFGARLDLIPSFRLMIEGLTECFTQFLLLKHYSRVHEKCVRTEGTYCSLTYRYETVIWCALAEIIGYQALNQIYFWNGQKDWEALFEGLVNHIRKKYPGFQNILTSHSKLPTMTRLHQECGKRMGAKYSEAYRSYSDLFGF
jgi:hypothetical protein